MMSVRAQVEHFREVLMKWDGVCFDVYSSKRPFFGDKERYPEDFQLFMEIVGEINVGSKNGYLLINIEEPRTPREVLDGACGTDLFLIDAPISQDVDVDVSFFDCSDMIPMKHVLYVGQNVDSEMFGFDNRYLPYRFVRSGILGDDIVVRDGFLSWLKEHLNSFMEYDGFKVRF